MSGRRARIPTSQSSSSGFHRLSSPPSASAPGRQGELVAGALPDLHEGLREALELAAGRRQPRAVAVSDEKLAAQPLLQRADAR
jgi:hypothetical protein